MPFFANDNNDSRDQSTVDVQTRAEEVNDEQAHDEHPEHVQSDPVAVPQQRSGSPWSNAPGDDSAPAEQERADEHTDVVDDRAPFAGADDTVRTEDDTT